MHNAICYLLENPRGWFGLNCYSLTHIQAAALRVERTQHTHGIVISPLLPSSFKPRDMARWCLACSLQSQPLLPPVQHAGYQALTAAAPLEAPTLVALPAGISHEQHEHKQQEYQQTSSTSTILNKLMPWRVTVQGTSVPSRTPA